MDAIIRRRQQHVMVLSGDGTIHAIVDYLSRLPDGAWTPDLLLLPGGRTNLTALDLAPHGSALPMFDAALQRIRYQQWDSAIETRVALCVEQAPGVPHHGFFAGGAWVDDCVRACHEHRKRGEGRLHKGFISTPLSLIRIAFGALFSRSRRLPSPEMRIRARGCGEINGATRILLMTTLAHRSGPINPYAACGHGPMRLTVLTSRSLHFWRRILKVARGRFSDDMNQNNGYLSGHCDRIEIEGLSRLSLDGEPLDFDPTRPVVISVGPTIKVLRS